MEPKWHTVGIVGGLGPQATIDLYGRILKYCQKKVPQKGNSGYPPMYIHNANYAPFSPEDRQKPNPELINAMKNLEKAGAEFIAIASNTPHIFYKDLISQVSVPVLHIVEEVAKKLEERVSPVGIIGTSAILHARLYQERLEARGIKYVLLPGDRQTALDNTILSTMEGRNEPGNYETLDSAIRYLKSRGSEKIILGCTEFPIILKERANRDEFINPTQVLAESIVSFALKR